MKRLHTTTQRGSGNLGCILWGLLLVIAIMIAWKMLPVKLASAELYDFMVEQAKFAQNSSAERIRDLILKKARELDLPVDKKDIEVSKETSRVRMRCRYTVTVEFPFYTYNWEFDHQVDRDIFLF